MVTTGGEISPMTSCHMNILDSSKRIPPTQHKGITQYNMISLTLLTKIKVQLMSL